MTLPAAACRPRDRAAADASPTPPRASRRSNPIRTTRSSSPRSAGPEAPYERALEGRRGRRDTGPWPEISHSCTAADGSFADPSVRTSQLVPSSGPTACCFRSATTTSRPRLQRIADKIIDRLSKPCIVGTVAKRPGTTSDDCTVVSTSASSDARRQQSEHREPRSFLRRHGRGGPVLAVRPRRKRVHRPGGRDGGGIPPRRCPPGSPSACSARCAWRACPIRPAGAPDPTSLSWSANLICVRCPAAPAPYRGRGLARRLLQLDRSGRRRSA